MHRISIPLLIAFFCNLLSGSWAYLNELDPPFTMLTPSPGQVVKIGSEVLIEWRIEPYTRYPIYGYAAAKTARTIAGLLDTEAGIKDPYVKEVDHNVLLTEGNYTWVVTEDVLPGQYRFGLGFYKHEASPVFTVVK